MARNAELLHAIADRIETDPRSYNQYLWGKVGTCGTKHCIAGWAVHLHDGEEAIDFRRVGLFRKHATRVEVDHKLVHIAHRAQTLLGINQAESDVLFRGRWKPRGEMTPAEALRRFADGASILTVTDVHSLSSWDYEIIRAAEILDKAREATDLAFERLNDQLVKVNENQSDIDALMVEIAEHLSDAP